MAKQRLKRILPEGKALNKFLKICKKDRIIPTYKDIDMLLGIYNIFHRGV